MIYRRRLVGVLTIVGCAVLWAAALGVGLIAMRRGAESPTLSVVDGWLRALASTVTVCATVLHVAQMSRTRFEHGYLACEADHHEQRVVSIASHGKPEKLRDGDRRESNKVG